MLRYILMFLALYCATAVAALAADPLDEVHRPFAIGDKPVHR